MINPDKKAMAGLAVLGLAAIGIIVLLFPLGMVRYFTDRTLLMNIITEHRSSAAFIFIALQTLQVIAAPVPGEVTGFVGGMFFGKAGGIIYSTIGLTIGSWLAFVLARFAGRPVIEKVINPETIKRYDYVMQHRGLFLAFLMFLIPGFPKDMLCYVLGLGHMGHRHFLFVSTTGRLLGTVLLTLQGEFFRNRRYGAFFTVLGISLACILIIMIYRTSIERWLKNMRIALPVETGTEQADGKTSKDL